MDLDVDEVPYGGATRNPAMTIVGTAAAPPHMWAYSSPRQSSSLLAIYPACFIKVLAGLLVL